MAKVGLIALPMQNYEEHDKYLIFMSGSLMMSKLRILDGSPSWDFNLGEFQFGRKFK